MAGWVGGRLGGKGLVGIEKLSGLRAASSDAGSRGTIGEASIMRGAILGSAQRLLANDASSIASYVERDTQGDRMGDGIGDASKRGLTAERLSERGERWEPFAGDSSPLSVRKPRGELLPRANDNLYRLRGFSFTNLALGAVSGHSGWVRRFRARQTLHAAQATTTSRSMRTIAVGYSHSSDVAALAVTALAPPPELKGNCGGETGLGIGGGISGGDGGTDGNGSDGGVLGVNGSVGGRGGLGAGKTAST